MSQKRFQTVKEIMETYIPAENYMDGNQLAKGILEQFRKEFLKKLKREADEQYKADHLR